MATVPKAAVTGREAPPRLPERGPNLMRFGLRQLFFFVSLTTVFCAVMVELGGPWRIMLGSVLVLVAAHVFGTFVGTRLRDTSTDRQQWPARPGGADRDEPVAALQPVRVADLRLPATSLASHEKIGRWRHWLVIAGTATGSALGAAAIHCAGGDQVTWPGLMLGAVSCGVIGAWVALLGVNFLAIARHTLREANRAEGRQRREES